MTPRPAAEHDPGPIQPAVLARWVIDAFVAGDVGAIERWLQPWVTWRRRSAVAAWREVSQRLDRRATMAVLRARRAHVGDVVAREYIALGDRVVVALHGGDWEGRARWYPVLTIRAGRVAEIEDCAGRRAGLAAVGLRARAVPPVPPPWA